MFYRWIKPGEGSPSCQFSWPGFGNCVGAGNVHGVRVKYDIYRFYLEWNSAIKIGLLSLVEQRDEERGREGWETAEKISLHISARPKNSRLR